MEVVALGQAGIAAPVVRHHGCARRHGALNETAQRLGASVGQQGKPDAPGVTTGLPLVEAITTFPLAHLDGAGHQHLVVNATTLAAGTAANPDFIGLDVFSGLPADPVLIRTHHAGTQLVEDLERGFVARQPKLSLELNGRRARRLAGDQVGRPEPYRERRVRTLHDRSGRETRVAVAMAATENAGAIREAIRLIDRPTRSADKSLAPSCALQIGRAG